MKFDDQSRAFCSIINIDYLPLALTLCKSISRFQEQKIVILCLDFKLEKLESLPNVQFVTIEVLDSLDGMIKELFSYHDIVEVATLVKPFFMEYLLMNFDIVTFLDPDVFVLQEIPLTANMNSSECVGAITPHRLTANTKTRKLEADFLQHGVFNLGFMELNQKSKEFLEWWKDRVLWNCSRYPYSPFFTDQKWIDLAATFFDLRVLHDSKLNVAPWNFDERHLEIRKGQLCSEGTPVVFIHFSQGASFYLRGEYASVWRKNPIANDQLLKIIRDLEDAYISDVQDSITFISSIKIDLKSGPTKRGHLYRFYSRERRSSGQRKNSFEKCLLVFLVAVDLTRLLSLGLFVRGFWLDIGRIKTRKSGIQQPPQFER